MTITAGQSSLALVRLTVLSVLNSGLLPQYQYPLFKASVFMRGHCGIGSDNGLQ